MPSSGSTTARGYGSDHQRTRAAALRLLASRIAQGITTACTRCGDPVLLGQRLDLDHTEDRTGYRGLAHRSCNRSAGARKSNARRSARPVTSRDW